MIRLGCSEQIAGNQTMQPSGEVGRFEVVDLPSPPADRNRSPTEVDSNSYSTTALNLRSRYSLSALLLMCFLLACGFAGYRTGFNVGYASGSDKRESERPFVCVHSLDAILELADTNGVKTDDPGQWWTEYLINVIYLTVAPDSWETEGGDGYLAPGPDDRTLIVTQTASVHKEIEDLLTDIEEIRRRAKRLPEYGTFASDES